MEYTKLLPLVLPMVRNVPKASAVNALRDAAIEFCAKTGVWVVDLDPVIIPAGSNIGEIYVPEEAVISRVKRVTNVFGVEIFGYSCTRNILTLDETLPAEGTFIITAVLKPSALTNILDDAIAEEFGSGIANGATARLKAQSGTEWFDATGASAAMTLFQNDIASAKMDVIRKISGPVRINVQSLF